MAVVRRWPVSGMCSEDAAVAWWGSLGRESKFYLAYAAVLEAVLPACAGISAIAQAYSVKSPRILDLALEGAATLLGGFSPP